ncbi:amino acid permease [Brevundimonas fluminis]|jgi:arginine:agmatine antiporter|uniref:amino acid permease n=1 Tax=Brevundimonas fluminis TaxID=2487274 RepID=UPI000F6562F1|nr:amino acid permease [Brevundimonas fluminis]
MTDVVPETGRKLGWGLAALVVAGNMIGSGLYLLPVTLAPFGSSSLIGWLVAGVGAAVLALVFGALGRLKPGADGLAGFAETGLGRFFGFQVAIAFWTACLVGNVAVAVAATGYLAFFWPVLKDPVAATLCNLAIIWVATLAYVAGTRTASWLAAGALVVGLIPIVIAVAAGVAAFDPQLFAASWNPSGDSLKETVPASLVLIFWAYLGVESAAALSSRIRHPGKNLGRASLAGVALATLVYVGATVAVFGVIPLDALAASTSPYADLAARVFGASLAGFVAVCAVAKTIGTVGGWVMMGGETARAAARAGFLPKGFAQGDKTPLVNPLTGAAIMTIVAVLSGQPTLGEQFGMLVGVTSVLTLTIYGVCSAALIRLSPGTGGHVLGAFGLMFAGAAVIAAAAGYIVPTLVVVAITTLAWFTLLRGGKPAVDPEGEGA